jgi:hypothetical protein
VFPVQAAGSTPNPPRLGLPAALHYNPA